MEKLIVLGAANTTTDAHCYNTCFALQKKGEFLLVDAGGGNDILSQLKQAAISPAGLRHLIATQKRNDNLLSIVCLLRRVTTLMTRDEYEGTFHIWCPDVISAAIVTLAQIVLPKKLVDLIGSRVLLHPITDCATTAIFDCPVTFFDLHRTDSVQYGFSLLLSDKRKLTYLGDQPYCTDCLPHVQGTDILLCETMCLHSEAGALPAQQLSAAEKACRLAEQLKVSTLVLCPANNPKSEARSVLEQTIGKQFYRGNLLVPIGMQELILTQEY